MTPNQELHQDAVANTAKLKPGFTPPPWSYREAFDNGEPCGYVVQSGVNAIAGVPQGEDDARLITASPTLFKACQAALRVFNAWKRDANPDGALRLGDSAEYDSACHMAELMESALSLATGQTK